MITFDKDRIYTWGRLKRYFRWSEEYVYHLHAKDYDYQDQWSVMLPILVRAMVASDDHLFVLGPEGGVFELYRHLPAGSLFRGPGRAHFIYQLTGALLDHWGAQVLLPQLREILGLYAAASWVVLQIVDVLKQNMGLPDWVFPFALLLLLIGLPIIVGTALVQGRHGGHPDGGSAGRFDQHDRSHGF